ncbi:PspC domain-containing protein [Nocardioides sp.]|uniref:PspC domain-containing protein n=1 Tax=Nocardioides sp. TaxID=35761 RepID=UPI003D0BCA66
MTTTPPPAPQQDTPYQGAPRVSAEEMRDLARLRRSRSDRKLAGVAGGLGRHFDLDPTIFRVGFVVLALFGGAGLLLYGVSWLLVPDEGTDHAKINIEPSARSVVLIGLAVVSVLLVVGDSSGVFDFPWPVFVVGIVILAVIMSRQDRQVGTGGPPPGQPAGTVSLDKQEPPTVWQPAPPVVRPYRGPGLFLATVALIAVGLGILWLVDLSGTDVPGGAYPALALAICGAMLVLGAWYGRAGGVLFLAMISGLGLGAANLAAHGIGGTENHTPQTAAGVAPSYDVGIGELKLDLRDVRDLEALDGRTINLSGTLASIDVIVPAGIDVVATGDIDGGGNVEIFGDTDDGDSPHLTRSLDGGTDVPSITINAELDLGSINVRNP